MDSILEKEILGEPVTVSLGDKEYRLGFPIFAVGLYKQETQKLNCQRAKAAADAGRAKLTPAEVREMKVLYRQLCESLGDSEKSIDERNAAGEEAVAIKSRLDEEAGIGDSLFQIVNWWKIREDDPDRILLALWAGLHEEQTDETWKAPFTLGQLRKLIDFSNVVPVLNAITRALGAYMPKVKSKATSPNAARPEESLPAETATTA